MDGECALQQYSAFLVCYPPFCGFLAQNAPLTISALAADLGGDHLCAGLGDLAMAFRAALLFSVDVGARRLLMFSSLRTYTGIRSGFGTHKLSGEAELRPQEHAQELVTTGLHARMRHPIYVAHLLNLAGWSIGSGLTVSFVLLAVSALGTFPLMVWIEEHELEKRFGQELSRVQGSRAADSFAIPEDIRMSLHLF